MKNLTDLPPMPNSGGIEFMYWLKQIGKSRPSGFRWRKKGWVKTKNIDGFLFVTTEEIARFWTRAKAGEFRRKPSGAAATDPV